MDEVNFIQFRRANLYKISKPMKIDAISVEKYLQSHCCFMLHNFK